MFAKKKWLFLLCSILAVALLAGCGTAKEEPKTDANSDAAQQEAGVIPIGLNFELSGGVASFGQSSVNAIELAFDEINKAGGVLGKQIKPIKYDNKSDKTEALNVATRLITQDKVVALIGPVTSGNTLSVVPIAEQRQVPVLAPTATNPDVTINPTTKKVNEFIFRACFLDSFQGKAAAQFAIGKGKSAAVLVSAADEYSKGLGAFFRDEFVAAGGTIVADEVFNKEDQDYNSVLTKVKSTNPDVIFIPAYYEEVGKMVKQARGLDITVPIIGSDGWDSPKLIEVAGVENLNNTFFTNHYTPEDQDPAVQSFVTAYQAKTGQVPDALAALGYDAAYLIVDAIKRADSDDPVKIKEALAATKDFPAITGKLTLDENHDPVKDIVIIEMKAGKQTVNSKMSPN